MADTFADELVAALARRAGALDIALHTVQVSVGGETLAHAVSDPLGLDTPQRMYSVAKTVTGLAIGMLADEGALSLDDPVTKHFPEMSPVHPWLEATTIRHMLAMRGPHRSTTYKLTAGGWLESYFRVPPTHPPGTIFTYDTSASYVLAALVERLSGLSLPEYLRPRLLDPLGISPGLRFLTGPEGISHGGSGLVCTPRDLLRLAHLLLDGGTHDSARLLPANYLRDAVRPQADTSLRTSDVVLRGGYGYQLWLPRPGSWLLFGLCGQIVYGDPARSSRSWSPRMPRRARAGTSACSTTCSSGSWIRSSTGSTLSLSTSIRSTPQSRTTGGAARPPPSGSRGRRLTMTPHTRGRSTDAT
ncbi:serine hydrolase domain-containing protein [Promicromonospora soli]